MSAPQACTGPSVSRGSLPCLKPADLLKDLSTAVDIVIMYAMFWTWPSGGVLLSFATKSHPVNSRNVVFRMVRMLELAVPAFRGHN